MPKYVALIYGSEEGMARASQEDAMLMMKAYDELTRAAQAAGVFEAGEGLQPTTTATTVRVRNGEATTTDGPFAETKEALGGFYAFNCKDLDEAIEWASRIPGASYGCVEVRPVMDYPTE